MKSKLKMSIKILVMIKKYLTLVIIELKAKYYDNSKKVAGL